MNADNLCHFSGTIVPDLQEGDNWTRWRAPRQGVARGQVRFWLAVSRALAGDGADRLLCAIEPQDVTELERYRAEVRAGRTVHLVAEARSQASEPTEERPAVVFVAESCGFDGREAVAVHQRVKLCGKMAAAGDDTGAELFA